MKTVCKQIGRSIQETYLECNQSFNVWAISSLTEKGFVLIKYSKK